MGLHRLTSSGRVYDLLKAEILRSIRPPGDPLVEHELSEVFGVSKTPVREALGKLTQEGLVTLLPRRGWVVAPITITDIQDGYHLRRLLEPEAAALATMHMSDSALSEIGRRIYEARAQHAAGMDTATSVLPDTVPPRVTAYPSQEVLDSNLWFHMEIAQASGNQWLASVIRQIVQRLQRMIQNDPNIALHQEHLEVISAIQTRDAELARNAMKLHISRGLERVINKFSGSGR